MIKKILVPLDGSISATHALNFALELASKFSAEIQLLTVVPPIVLPTYSEKVLTTTAISECRKRLEESFKGVLSKAMEIVKKKKPELKASNKFEHGFPDEKIIKNANQGDFDIIVIGGRGLGDRLFLGSVSSRVAEKATCPVLIVK